MTNWKVEPLGEGPWVVSRTDDLDKDTRRCANGQWLGCLALVLTFWAALLLGFIIAWVAGL